MSLRHAVAELIALWDSLPGLVGADWPGLAPLLTEAVDLLPGSASEQDFAARVAVILRLLQPYPGARERLAQALAADELRGDTPALTVAGSWSLLAHRLVMAAGGTGQTGQRPPAQWVNAEFEGHDAGRCLRPHQAYVLAFEAGPAARARAASVGAELRPGLARSRSS